MVPLLIAGAALSAAGTIWANKARADQEAANAWFYKKQAEFARQSMFYDLEQEAQRATQTMSQQKSALAKGGASLSEGSAAGILAMTAARSLETLAAIKKKGELEAELAFSRSDASQKASDTYGSFGYNLLTGASAAMPATAQAFGGK